MTTKNLNILSQKKGVGEKAEVNFIKQAKEELLETFNIDQKLINRNHLADALAKNRFENGKNGANQGIPEGQLHIGNNTIITIDQKKYKDIFNTYQKLLTEKPENFEKELTKLDTILAERITLDSGNMIEFKNNDVFGEEKNARKESKIAYNSLNEIDDYKGRIDLISKKDKQGNDYFIIKWTEKQLKEITKRARELKEEEEGGEQKLLSAHPEQKLLPPHREEEQKLLPPHPEQKLLPPHREEEQKLLPAHPEQKLLPTYREEPTPIEENNTVELTATISNTTKITRAIAEREAGEKLRTIYKNTARYKPRSWPTKAALFLGRGYMKDHYTRKFMDMKKGMQRDENLVKGADRHEMEKDNKFNDKIKNVGDIDENEYPETYKEIQILIDQCIQGQIEEDDFQKDFTSIIEDTSLDANKPSTAKSNRKPLSQIIKENDIQQMSSNVLEKTKEFRDHQKLVKEITKYIRQHPNTTQNDPVAEKNFDIFARKEIVKYFNIYQKNPAFLKTLNIKIDDKNAMQQLSNLQAHKGALTMIAAKTLKMKIQILTNGDEAYDIKQEGNTMTKIGDRLDKPISDESKFGKRLEKHPFTKNAFGMLRGGTKLGIMVTPAILLGLTGAGPLAIAGAAGTMAFTKTLFKKHSHYNNEHIGYQRNQAVNIFENRKKREELLNEIGKMNPASKFFYYYFGLGKTARDVRQMRDYVLTTHDQLEDSKTLADKMQTVLSKPILENSDPDQLERLIARSLARLNFHKETGQNFLGSADKDKAEKEYQTIYRLMLTGVMRLEKNLNDFENTREYKKEMEIIKHGEKNTKNSFGYQKSRKRFKHRQTEKALLGAVKAGGVAFGLSYLATSLASTKETTHAIGDQKNVGDSFVLGKHELGTDNAVYSDSKDFFQNPNAAHQTINYNYGGGTDAVNVIPGKLTQGEYLNKIAEAQKEIMQMTNIGTTTKMNLVHEIQNKPREQVRAEKGFTNDYLQGMRCVEGIEQAAKGLNDSGINASNITLNAAYNGSVYDVVGTTYKNAGERVVQGALDYSQNIVTPENIIPIPIPGYMNTFKAPDRYGEEEKKTRSTHPKVEK